MRVLVTGANGFIGARVVTALREAGHEPVVAVRNVRAAATTNAIACDFARDCDPAIWKPRLANVDAVVNCAGILRETRSDRFQTVHVDAPLALYRACVDAGVRRVIQISALGEPADGEFIASKHCCDQALSTLDLNWLVLRPGLVYSAHGAYGGTMLLRAMAALPGVLGLPRDGEQQLRPLAAEDLARAVVAALERPGLRAEIIELVGPDILTLRGYLLAWRQWFGLPEPRVVETPKLLADAMIGIGEWFGRGPLCRVIANLLEHRRVGTAQAPHRMRSLLGIEPLALADAMAACLAQSSDLLEARWYTMRLLLLFTLGLVWLASGVVGLLTPIDAAQAAMPQLPPMLAHVLAPAASGADLALGVALLSGLRTRLVLALMLAMVLGYSLVIGILAPVHWLDPFGGLLKNLPIAMVLIALLALEPRR